MNYTIVTEPTSEPITLTEAKLHLRVDNDVEDTLISALIVAARLQVEFDTWRALMTQTRKLSLDNTEVKTFTGITGSPIQSVSHVKYFDIDVVQQTMSTGSYEVNKLNEPTIIKLNTIPNMPDMMNAFEIQFVCGYASADLVPQPLKLAMLLLIGHWYEHREEVTVGNMKNIPSGYTSLISAYKLIFYPYNN